MAYLVAGPLVALVGIVAVFFVLRRKSVEKRSMYSARRSQFEHKVRAARQRTLTPRGRSGKPVAPAPEAASPYAPGQVQPTITYDAPAYQAPPVAPPPAPNQWQQPAGPAPNPWETASAPNPWETTSAPAPAPEYPAAPPEPAYTPPAPEPFRPAPEPTPMAPSQPVWTPAPEPASERVAPLEQATSASSSAAAGAWSVVNPDKDSSEGDQAGSRKGGDRGGGATGAWQLASGEAPSEEADEPEGRRSGGNLMAVAQYAILVVGLVMVLIGVLVMVANSQVT